MQECTSTEFLAVARLGALSPVPRLVDLLDAEPPSLRATEDSRAMESIEAEHPPDDILRGIQR